MNRGFLDLAVARSSLRPAEKLLLAETLETEAALAALSVRDLEALIGRPAPGGTWFPASLLARAAEDAAACVRAGASWVPYFDAAYPPLLREIADPPVVLFVRGRLPDPERPAAAVVGTRDPSSAGAAEAYELGMQFGRCGVPVVSGLARGVDAFAHRGNVDAWAPSVAVLGSGLDSVGPASNRPLARRLLAAGGALLSEYPPGTAALKHHFPARNRIIAALARAVVVVEAPAESGALITAAFALEGGRDLWIGRSGRDGRRGDGTRRLAADGAPIADSAYDVLSDWGLPLPGKPYGPAVGEAVPWA